jgi:hypothetical protein
VSFSTAAIERIVRCVLGEESDSEADPISLIVMAVQQSRDERSNPMSAFSAAGRLDNVVPRITAQRVLFVAGLLELAVTSGYVEAETDDLVPVHKHLLSFREAFLDTWAVKDDPLLRRFLDRRTGPRNDGVPSRTAFDAFESYLNLTSYVLADEACLHFLDNTEKEWEHDHDLAFLISPRQFAQALATGRVGSVPVADVAGGFSALRHHEWLASILDLTREEPDLRDGMLSHARWSHNAVNVSQRLKMWGREMSGWADEGEIETEVWRYRLDAVFGPIVEGQRRLGVALTERPETNLYEPGNIPVSTPPDWQRAEFLYAQGRIAEAQSRVRQIVGSLSMQLTIVDSGALPSAAEEFVRGCARLMEYGDVDSAAALVAPQIPFLVATLGYSDPVMQAARIVAAARAVGSDAHREIGDSENTEVEIESPVRRFLRERAMRLENQAQAGFETLERGEA